MRMLLVIAAVVPLAACAGGALESYGEEQRQLEQSCTARGGVLLPASGPSTGRAATDYFCRIPDGDFTATPED